MQVKLKDVCTVITDGSHSSPIGIKKGYPMLSVKDMRSMGFDYSDCKFISKKDYDILVRNGCKPQINDVLIAKDGSYLKEVFVVKEDIDQVILSSIAILRPDTTKINPYFLMFYLQTESVKEIVANKYVSGSALQRIILKNFKEIEIELPDRPIQDKIVEILSNIDNQIERNNEMTKRLQVLGNTIYSKNALMQTEFFNIQDESELIWGTCPPDGHILDAENPKTQKYASGAGDILDGCSLVYPKGYTDKPIRIAKEKDVCISIAGTIGKIGICTETIAIGRAMLGVRSKNLYGYIYFGLQTFGKTLNKKSTGAIQKIINKDHIKIINFPKYNEDIRIQLNNIFDEIVLIENDTIKLQNLKSKLLPLLINGQINI